MAVRFRISIRNLSSAERAVLRLGATGKSLDLRTGDPDLDKPANAAGWKVKRNIRASFLANLVTGDCLSGDTPLRAVKLRGARIMGELNLEARKLLCPLLLQDCYFDEPVNLSTFVN